MAEMKPLDVVQSFYRSLAHGDAPAALAALDPHVEWTEAEGFPCAGTYRGPDDVLNGVLARLGTEWTGFEATPDEFVDGGDTVVALGTYRGTCKDTGKSFQAPFAHLWRIRNGKAVRFVQYTDTALVQEALRR